VCGYCVGLDYPYVSVSGYSFGIKRY